MTGHQGSSLAKRTSPSRKATATTAHGPSQSEMKQAKREP